LLFNLLVEILFIDFEYPDSARLPLSYRRHIRVRIFFGPLLDLCAIVVALFSHELRKAIFVRGFNGITGTLRWMSGTALDSNSVPAGGSITATVIGSVNVLAQFFHALIRSAGPT